MMKRILLWMSLSLILLQSCGKTDEMSFPDGQGYISLNLSAENSQEKEELPVGNTQTRQLHPQLNPDEFSLELINSKGSVFKRWNTFAEIKGQKIPMNAGNFTARAWYGDPDAIGFEQTYFEGKQNFTVAGQASQDVTVTCSQGNVAVKVIFGDQIRADYEDYWATVKLKKSDTLKYLKNETRVGFLPAEDLYFRLHARDNRTKEVNIARHILSTAPGDFITLRVDTKPIPVFDVSLTITIDAVTDDRDVTIEIPSLYLPKDAPEINTSGMTENRVSLTEGVAVADAKVNLFADAGIKNCFLSTESQHLLSAGWPETMDLAHLTEDQKVLLETYHLGYSAKMLDQKMALIDFRHISENLKFTVDGSNEYIFKVRLVDTFGREVSGSYAVEIEKAIYSAPVFNDGNIWSSSVYIDSEITTANARLIVPQIKTTGGEWIVPEYTMEEVAGDAHFCITRLNPGQNYHVRFTYNQHASAEKQFTTESCLQIENAGFEDWQAIRTEFAYSAVTKYYFDMYYPYPASGNRWWDSNNRETTGRMTFLGEQRYKIFPTTSWTQGVDGGKAAQVMSISYNSTGVINNNETPGRLFIGQADDKGQVGVKGHSFASRPTSVSFYYQYDSYNDDEFSARIELYNGNTMIGSGEFRSRETTQGWNQVNTQIDYTNDQLKATSIYMIFVTSTGGAPCRRIDVTIPEGTFNTWAGSCLLLDDIQLIYKK